MPTAIHQWTRTMKLPLKSKCMLICIVPIVIFTALIASLSIVCLQRALHGAARKNLTEQKHEPYNP
jgi:hypothetical protein